MNFSNLRRKSSNLKNNLQLKKKRKKLCLVDNYFWLLQVSKSRKNFKKNYLAKTNETLVTRILSGYVTAISKDPHDGKV